MHIVVKAAHSEQLPIVASNANIETVGSHGVRRYGPTGVGQPFIRSSIRAECRAAVLALWAALGVGCAGAAPSVEHAPAEVRPPEAQRRALAGHDFYLAVPEGLEPGEPYAPGEVLGESRAVFESPDDRAGIEVRRDAQMPVEREAERWMLEGMCDAMERSCAESEWSEISGHVARRFETHDEEIQMQLLVTFDDSGALWIASCWSVHEVAEVWRPRCDRSLRSFQLSAREP
jgi:hypothetical protein